MDSPYSYSIFLIFYTLVFLIALLFYSPDVSIALFTNPYFFILESAAKNLNSRILNHQLGRTIIQNIMFDLLRCELNGFLIASYL